MQRCSGSSKHLRWAGCVLFVLALACSDAETPGAADDARDDSARGGGSRHTKAAAASGPGTIAEFPQREAFFGDLHVHTALSVDAFITHTRTLPDDAYRHARGEEIDHVSGEKIRIQTPLDFLAVSDHAELLGLGPAMEDPKDPLSKSPLASKLTHRDPKVSLQTFAGLVDAATGGRLGEWLPGQEAGRATRDAWREIIDAAERHDTPGRFTTFVAYEWSSMPDGANLHRNVIFAGPDVPDAPFSSLDSDRPEDLWAHLDAWRARGDDAIAIPHNANASLGRMYPSTRSSGRPIDAAHAEMRQRNEPVSELTQAKGTSETHPRLSPRDPFAGFELWNTQVGRPTPVKAVAGSYVRSAWRRGLEFESAGRANPYTFGVIGSSDSHDAASATEESNFSGGHGYADATPETRLAGKRSALTESPLNFSASGLAGVWAKSNTRPALFAALRRGETFATSGPRIRLRLYAADHFPRTLHLKKDAIARADARGVTMGGRLRLAKHAAPTLFVWALRDPRSAPLDRVQIVRLRAEDGHSDERIFDVVCSDGLKPDPDTHRCPDNGASVDLETCTHSPDVGAGQLSTTWTDPEPVGDALHVYYARVLENPTCRWSSWDALRLGVPRPRGVPATIRERAWSSPIWVEGPGA